jgi:membrane fusion protein, multidrug efflux system
MRLSNPRANPNQIAKPICRIMNLATRGVTGLIAAALAVLVPCRNLGAEGLSPASVRGVVRAEASAVISSELLARVSSLPFKAGQSFQAQDVLVTFDCRRYEADLRAAEAEVKTQEILVETNRKLLHHRAAGTNELALAEAKLGQAMATADSLRVRTSQCVILAPYDGRVIERAVDVYEMPQANAPLLRIVKDGQLELDLIVPSSWSAWLKPGYEFEFSIDEIQATSKARLLFPGAVIDPVSRTIRVTALLVDPPPAVRPGMSGSARLRMPMPEAK